MHKLASFSLVLLLAAGGGAWAGQGEDAARDWNIVARGESDSDETPGMYKLVLVRHAEKAAGGFDPDLTDYGRARAEFFADWQAGKKIQAVWSSDFKRTMNTARPLAQRLGLPIEIYDPRDQVALVDRLLDAGVNAVVVGHSNTIPELASLLCKCDVDPMPDTEYERAFVIVRIDGKDVAGKAEPDFRKLWTDRPQEEH